MEQVMLSAQERKKSGTVVARQERSRGVIPAVVYAKGTTPMHITTDSRELTKMLQQKGENVIINLAVGTGKTASTKTVIIKEIQYDTIKDTIIHVDFQHISMTEKIRMDIPVVTRGDADAQGVKDGGILEHIIREIEVECLPTNIPKEIVVDVTGLKVGVSIHVGDIKAPDGVTILTDKDQIVALIKYEAEEKPAAEPVAEAAAAGAEPEVIKKGKVDEEAAPEK